MNSLVVHPSNRLSGVIDLPGDKSISHRSVIFGAIAEGTTKITNLLEGEDVLCTVDCFRKMGISISKKGRLWSVEGRGLRGLRRPKSILYCGNSGTTMRLLTGLLAACPFEAILTGDASLNRRPMGRVMEPLRTLGANLEERRSDKGRFLHVRGGDLRPGNFKISVASAQLKTALLLAGLVSGQKMAVTEPVKSRDHTERMLKAFGADLHISNGGRTVRLLPSRELKAQEVIVPGDFSSAAFFLVLGLVSGDAKTKIVIRNVGLNKTRTGALEVLKKMGGKIRVLNRKTVCGEPVGDLECRPSRLKGVKISGAIIPRLIDEVPILAVAAAMAQGRTVIRNAEELRVKEADRIRALARELPRFGVAVRELPDGLEIKGGRPLHGAEGRSYGDHRMAMSLAVLGTVCEGATHIDDTDCIATSFPTFVPLLKKVGGRIKTL